MTHEQTDLITVGPDMVHGQACIRAAAAYGASLAREEIIPLPA